MKQGQAVFNTLTSLYLEQNGTAFTNESPMTSKDFDLAKAKAILVEGFTKGEIDISPDFDMTKITSYVGGLINNWMRKDLKLNGNVKYEAKNPGSRAGSGDKQAAALKALMKQIGEKHEKYTEVKAAYEARLAEIKPKSQVQIDANLLPDDLKFLVE